MKKFTIDIACENDAFGNSHTEEAQEIARILEEMAHLLRCGQVERAMIGKTLKDINGNRVGEALFSTSLRDVHEPLTA